MENTLEKKGWLARNWKWLVPVVGLGALLACLACITLVATAIFGTLKSSEPYQLALARVQESPEAAEALGTPIQAGFWAGGSIQVTGPTGGAELSIPVSGPKGSGTVYMVAVKTLGTWKLLTLELALKGSDSRIKIPVGG